jgi:serine/threonine protein kinase
MPKGKWLGRGSFGTVYEDIDPKDHMIANTVTKKFHPKDDRSESNSESTKSIKNSQMNTDYKQNYAEELSSLLKITKAADAKSDFKTILENYTLLLPYAYYSELPLADSTYDIKYKNCLGMGIYEYMEKVIQITSKKENLQKSWLKDIFVMTGTACLNVVHGLQTYCANVNHCDLNWRNVMYCDRGGRASVRVIDFGLANETCKVNTDFSRLENISIGHPVSYWYGVDHDIPDVPERKVQLLQHFNKSIQFTPTDTWKNDYMTVLRNLLELHKSDPKKFEIHKYDDMFAIGLMLSLIYVARYDCTLDPFDQKAYAIVLKLLKEEYNSTTEILANDWEKLVGMHGGSKTDTFVNTKYTITDSKGKTRSIYEKNGIRYIKKRSKKTNKFTYIKLLKLTSCYSPTNEKCYTLKKMISTSRS